MVSESGPTEIRYAPAPQRFDLTDASREDRDGRASLDLHARGEGDGAGEEAHRRPRRRVRRDPGPAPLRLRRSVHASCRMPPSRSPCTRTDASGPARWFDADRGLPQFRIVRTGCFRGGVPLPPGAGRPDAMRFKAYTSAADARRAAASRGQRPVTLTRVNRVFTVDDRTCRAVDCSPGPGRCRSRRRRLVRAAFSVIGKA